MFLSLFKFFNNAFKQPDIRKKLLITILVLFFFRLAAHIPAAGIDTNLLRTLFISSPILSLLDVFSGGTLINFSVMALGLGPYISASIIVQLLQVVIPKLEELSQEGEYGQEQMDRYTRYLTLPLATFQAFAMYFLLKSQGVITTLQPLHLAALIITMVAGSCFAIWLGDLITEYGISNGVSFLIFAGIIARLPVVISQSINVVEVQDFLKTVIFGGVLLLVIGLIVYMNEAIRKIPVNYSRRTRIIGTNFSYLPLRLNQANVIPIIFAVSVVMMPSFVSQFLVNAADPRLKAVGNFFAHSFTPRSFWYNIVYFLLVVGFTFFYTAVIFNPEKIAENLQKSGGFIPGIRPGSQTVSYLNDVLAKITLAGAIFLGLVAIMPSLIQSFFGIANLAIGGTGVLIVVSVVLEVMRNLESQLVMKKYDRFFEES